MKRPPRSAFPKRRITARPSLGDPGKVWVEIEGCVDGQTLGAHLTRIEATELLNALALALHRMDEDQA